MPWWRRWRRGRWTPRASRRWCSHRSETAPAVRCVVADPSRLNSHRGTGQLNVSTSGIYKCQVTPAGNGRTHVPEVDGVGEVEGGDDANVALEGVPPLHHEVPGAILFWGSYVRVCLVVKGKRSNKPAGGECMIHSKALAGTDRSEGIMEPLSARLSPTAKSQMSTLSCARVHGG